MQTSTYRADAFQKCRVKDINGVLFTFSPNLLELALNFLHDAGTFLIEVS